MYSIEWSTTKIIFIGDHRYCFHLYDNSFWQHCGSLFKNKKIISEAVQRLFPNSNWWSPNQGGRNMFDEVQRDSHALVKIEMVFIPQIKLQRWEYVIRDIYSRSPSPYTGQWPPKLITAVCHPPFTTSSLQQRSTPGNVTADLYKLVFIHVHKPYSTVRELKTESVGADHMPKRGKGKKKCKLIDRELMEDFMKMAS